MGVGTVPLMLPQYVLGLCLAMAAIFQHNFSKQSEMITSVRSLLFKEQVESSAALNCIAHMFDR